MENVFLEFPPLPKALEQIAALSEEQYQALQLAVGDVAGPDTSFARCKAIKKQLGGKLNSFDVYNILRSLLFLGSRYNAGGSETSESELRDFFEFIGLDKLVTEKHADRIYARVSKLLADGKESSDHFEKRWRLETAIVDAAQDFEWAVDLRPSFSDDGSSVEEFVPVVMFRVMVANDYGDEKSYVFQMSQESVTELQGTLEAINEQLAIVGGATKSLSSVLENA